MHKRLIPAQRNNLYDSDNDRSALIETDTVASSWEFSYSRKSLWFLIILR